VRDKKEMGVEKRSVGRGAGFLIGLVLLSGPGIAVADEPAEQFLAALRDVGYYDIAVDYLKELESSDLVSKEFRESLPLEMAETLIESAKRDSNPQKIEQQLNEAQHLLSKSASSADNPEMRSKALGSQANLLFARATAWTRRGNDSKLLAQERNEFRAKAQAFLKQAAEVSQRAQESLASAIRDFQIDPEDPTSANQLKKLQSRYTQVRILVPLISEQLSETYDASDPERATQLQQAAAKYEELWEKYPTYRAGKNACLSAARCHFKLRDYRRALSFLQEIFNFNDTPAYREIRTQAMVLAADCWKQTNPYPFDEVIAAFEPFVKSLSRVQLRSIEAQRLQLELARAYFGKSKSLEDQDGDSGQITALKSDAAKSAKSVARVPSPFRKEARELLATWNISITEPDDEPVAPITSFNDARQRGMEAVLDVESSLADVDVLVRELRNAKLEDEKQAKQSELNDARQHLEKLAHRALEYLNQALALKDNSIPRNDINDVRYLQSVCYFAVEQYYEAALIGEFLLERYPSMPRSQQAAGLVLRSYQEIIDRAPAEQRASPRRRLSEICSSIVNRWPGSNEAIRAAFMLAHLAIGDNRLADARKYLAAIPASTPARETIAAELGRKLWFEYKDKRKIHESDPEQVTAAHLSEMLTEAKQLLVEGVRLSDQSPLTYSAAVSALLLIDAHLESDDVALALEQLEMAKVAPLDLVKQKSDVVFADGRGSEFAAETYKVAVKTYLAALKQQPDQRQWIDKAQGIIRAMRSEAESSSDEAAKQQIVAIYWMIATELKQQFLAIKSDADQMVFADNLAAFLASIEKDSTDPKAVYWAAATLASVAQAMADANHGPEAARMFQQAISAFDRASQIGLNDENMSMELKRQRALALRGTGKYETAFQELVEILKSSPNLLSVQIDAANTLLEWGKSTNNSKPIAQALMGAVEFRNSETKRTTNLVWGWQKLVQVLRDKPEFESDFYGALYGVIEARSEYGRIAKNPRALESALKELSNARARDAKLGGIEWKSKFDQLEKRIQNIEATGS
jgi:hypothetical protein